MTDDIRTILERFPAILEQVRPLTASQRRSLPEDIFRLSRLLTTERRELVQPYWGNPALVSAYVYYFLPWNMVRLAWLLRLFPLPALPELADAAHAWLVDMGSGPLSLPLALWLARPDLRSAPIRVFAQDSSRQPLALGQRLLQGLAASLGQTAWPVTIHQGPLESATRTASQRRAPGDRLWLVSAANVLNEFCQGRHNGQHRTRQWETDGEDEDSAQAGLEMRLAPLLEQLGAVLQRASGASLLCVEPGTRLGGKIVMQARSLLLAQGLHMLAPCTHGRHCPLERGRSWCHFTFPAQDAPRWLTELSARANLAKDMLSLSPLLATHAGSAGEATPQAGTLAARVVSAPFAVPGLRGRARYACTGRGLVLLEDAAALPSGAVREIVLPADARRDSKSGALIVPAGAPRAKAACPEKRATAARNPRPGAQSTGQKRSRSRQGQRKP